MSTKPNRRTFLRRSAVGAALAATSSPWGISQESAKPAALGGAPVRKASFASWPQIQANDKNVWSDVLEKKGWCRLNGDYVKTFEREYAAMLGARDCIATSSGTTALFSSLNALGVGPGDEVIVSPYTFVASVNVILLQHAVPVFVDTDRASFQIDATKIEAAITERTKCIIPVHLGGYPADLDKILAVAKKHNIPVLEDACQAHLAEWRGKKVGTIGDLGCFSFQVTKNLSGGEGGAITGSNEELMDRCFSFHSNGRERKNTYGFQYLHNGVNARMTEFQGAILTQQMTRIEAQAKRRSDNADYLTSLLDPIAGIHPAKLYDGVTQSAYHLYMLRYDPKEFSGLPRDKFKSAMQKEGIPCSTGYSPLNKEPFLDESLNSAGYQTIYGKEYINRWFKNNHLPENDRLCEEAIWFLQFMLLGEKSDMEQIAVAIRKIQQHSSVLAKA
ncbi:MAG: DegT/DnrJ/EryC1/StrS family aminotransferase [Candidatus Hinthialibacter antarcticus]|nr:DegT/DnrJ/EryC1/StrS family aminotransferase [Candidatus Hinthialibacter antarcticus]